MARKSIENISTTRLHAISCDHVNTFKFSAMENGNLIKLGICKSIRAIAGKVVGEKIFKCVPFGNKTVINWVQTGKRSHRRQVSGCNNKRLPCEFVKRSAFRLPKPVLQVVTSASSAEDELSFAPISRPLLPARMTVKECNYRNGECPPTNTHLGSIPSIALLSDLWPASWPYKGTMSGKCSFGSPLPRGERRRKRVKYRQLGCMGKLVTERGLVLFYSYIILVPLTLPNALTDTTRFTIPHSSFSRNGNCICN